jgi:hypothetical protein
VDDDIFNGILIQRALTGYWNPQNSKTAYPVYKEIVLLRLTSMS